MKRYYSNIDKNCLLFVINKKEEITKNRNDLSPDEEYLQCATKLLSAGDSFKPHRHNTLERKTDKTQEAWVFLSGKVKAKFYDIDDSLFLETELCGGDCAVVFNAGHGFEVIDDDTILYEFKTGPYYGMTADKTHIEV